MSYHYNLELTEAENQREQTMQEAKAYQDLLYIDALLKGSYVTLQGHGMANCDNENDLNYIISMLTTYLVEYKKTGACIVAKHMNLVNELLARTTAQLDQINEYITKSS